MKCPECNSENIRIYERWHLFGNNVLFMKCKDCKRKVGVEIPCRTDEDAARIYKALYIKFNEAEKI